MLKKIIEFLFGPHDNINSCVLQNSIVITSDKNGVKCICFNKDVHKLKSIKEV